jgi:hypothetical protein
MNILFIPQNDNKKIEIIKISLVETNRIRLLNNNAKR